MTTDADDFFPDSPRVHYEQAPLTEVICQLRFPQILRIETTPPADFQDRVRATFPLLEKPTGAVSVPPGVEVPIEVLRLFEAQSGVNAYRFLTEDRSSTLTLSPDSLALSTVKYETWEEFRSCLDPAISALIAIYKPSFFLRVGLRYTNKIERARIGLSDRPWSALLRKEILGELALPQFENNVQVANRVIRLTFKDGGGSIQFRHGLSRPDDSGEVSYTLDFDFFIQRTDVQDAGPILDRFNRRAGRAFRWAITETLHRALGPRELPT